MNKLIYFYKQDCAPCQSMNIIISQIQSTGIPVEKINTESGHPFMSSFRISSVPTIIKVNRSNKEIGRLTGFNTFGRINDLYQQG